MKEELEMMNFEGEIVLTCQAIIPKPEKMLSDEGASYKIYTLAVPALNGARRPKQAIVDVAPVRTLIAGNLRDGPSTSTPAQAAAFGPFTALIFPSVLDQAKRDTSVVRK
ncbi:hypothetical protein ACG2F4_06170 [Halalkalibaculum sp. DA3122]|uniref:hypothetical protein n=1 Tax=unclassified Halalkalibaculum TaxID=2964617 RepID=UPI003754EF9B